MSSTQTERPAYDSWQGNAVHQLAGIIDAVDTARAAAEAAKPKVWHFASTADARAAVDQDHVNDGDVLVVDSEKTVGFVAVVYPVAITEEHGAFHAYSKLGKPAREYSAGAYTASVELAEQTAIELGATLADPVAAQAVRIADGKPAPIEIPRLFVEPGDILHGFGVRLRVIDTGTRISEQGDGEWWALVEGVTEDDSRRTYRGRWGFAVPVAAAAWDVVTVERVLSPANA
ncbi:hypothetical protein ACH46L_03680 [Streptomyces althioticus]|uniref:hypothetical protein n=1 Tax=Streptomyces althioticus TaxID=83380 RepID=UPI00379C39A0